MFLITIGLLACVMAHKEQEGEMERKGRGKSFPSTSSFLFNSSLRGFKSNCVRDFVNIKY